MKTPLLLTFLLAAGALAAAPAEAAPDVPDPTGDCAGAAVVDACWSVYWPGCNLWLDWDGVPVQDSCLYRSGPLLTSSAGPDAQCMDVYRQTHLAGPYWLVQRDSCSAELHECPEGYTPPAPPCHRADLLTTSASSAVSCYMVYSRTNVGTAETGYYSIVRRTSCSPPEVYRCPYANAPIDRCHYVWDGILAATASASQPPVGLPPIHCSDIYARHEVGPAAVVLTSGCSGHVEVCDEKPALDTRAPLQSVETDCLRDYLPTIDCMPYTRELDLGPVTVEQGGCGSDVEVCGDSVLDGRVDTGCLLAPVATSAPEPMCMYYYYEYEAGPVRYVQRDSCHSEAYVCGDRVDPKDPFAPQTDEARLRMCIQETLGRYISME